MSDEYSKQSSIDPPKARTNVDIPKDEGKDLKFEKVDNLNVREVLNMELFYNQQITNLNISWILNHPKSNLSIVGITQEHTYGFSVDNQYNSGTGGAIGQSITSFLNGVHGWMHDKAAIKTEAKDTWLPGLKRFGDAISSEVDSQRTNEDQGQSFGATLQKGVGSAISGLSDIAISGLERLDDSNSFPNKLASLLFEGKDTPTITDISNGKVITSFDKVMTYGGSNLMITLPTLKTYIFHNPVTNGQNVLKLTEALVDVIAPQTHKSSIPGLYAVQTAPGGYRVDLNAFDSQNNPMEGTWTLVWNGYTMHNLLVSNLVVNYSKYNAMNNSGLDSGDPLYAEIDITLALASMLTSEDVMSIMTNTRTRYKTSGWNDSDWNDANGTTRGVTSKEYDIAGIGTNRHKNVGRGSMTTSYQ